jgi:uncharacterized membrane protein YgcG
MVIYVALGIIAFAWLSLVFVVYLHCKTSPEQRAASDIWERDQKLAGRRDAGTYGAFSGDGGAGSCGGDGGGGSCS